MAVKTSSPANKTAVSGEAQRTSLAQRRVLFFASGLVLTMGFFLYLLSDNTQTFFAWTIGVPLTAAFLGAGYWASFFLELLAAREQVWAKSRIAVPAVLIFTLLTLILTLIHLDKFHFNAPEIITVILTWGWLIVYALQPFGMGYVYFRQLRVPGSDPARLHPLPTWFKGVIGVQFGIMILLGLGLFLIPEQVAPLWAWELTPLTGRAIGAWLIGVGIGLGQTIMENDWARIRPMMAAFAAYGVLQLINLLRYPTAAGLDWSAVKTWLYVAFLISVLAAGVYGSWMSQKAYRADKS